MKNREIKDYDYPTVHNKPRERLIQGSKTHTQRFFDKLREGELMWFWQNIQKRKMYEADEDYAEAKTAFQRTLYNAEKNIIRVTDVKKLFENILDKNVSTHAFSDTYEKYGFESRKSNGVKILDVEWDFLSDEEIKEQLEKELDTVPF